MVKWLFLLLLLTQQSAGCGTEVIISSGTNTKVDRGGGVFTQAVYQPDQWDAWVKIPYATWVWVSLGEILGGFTFVDSFVIPDWILESVSHFYIYVSVDDWIEGEINGQVFASDHSCYCTYICRYDITPFVIGSGGEYGVRPNELRIRAFNIIGPGGLSYRVDVEYCRER